MTPSQCERERIITVSINPVANSYRSVIIPDDMVHDAGLVLFNCFMNEREEISELTAAIRSRSRSKSIDLYVRIDTIFFGDVCVPRSKRVFDFLLALTLMFLLSPLLVVIALLVRLTSRGPALYWSDRVGVRNKIFRMPKFRSMRMDTPQVATHLMTSPSTYLTPLGDFLRRTSIDEIPQLWSILRGDLSFVGPRPALFNQDDLIALRTQSGIHLLTPGLTGWAQVNGRDELSIPTKVEFDKEYLNRQSLIFDVRIILLTAVKAIRGIGVHH